MSRTGLEDAYIMRGSKKLRMGYTTGSCAAAAARGAAFMLLSGKEIQEVKIHTPKGIVLNLELLDIRRSAEKVSCAVRKDGGDDPDVTDKALIYAEVTFGTEEGIVIDGGFGVGRVTKPGLDQPVGNEAINPVPRQMIRGNVENMWVAKETGFGYLTQPFDEDVVRQGRQCAQVGEHAGPGVERADEVLALRGVDACFAAGGSVHHREQ